jgi:GDP/UDP-N,N'-diacetylbacillosamine 2-epimerase (hydrolysing)
MVRIAVLTSSRADFGVYSPLLNKIQNDAECKLTIIAFGTHLSEFHGYTINEILANGFDVKYRIPTAMSSDSAESIATSAALCSLKFSSFWAEHLNMFGRSI